MRVPYFSPRDATDEIGNAALNGSKLETQLIYSCVLRSVLLAHTVETPRIFIATNRRWIL